jgi:hypothetical protein
MDTFYRATSPHSCDPRTLPSWKKPVSVGIVAHAREKNALAYPIELPKNLGL